MDRIDITVENLPRLIDALKSDRLAMHDIIKIDFEICNVTRKQKGWCDGTSCNCKAFQEERQKKYTDLRRSERIVHDTRLLRGDISFNSRGIGNDFKECFICGKSKPNGVNNNIAAYISSKEDGDTIVSWFNGKGAWTDFRTREPEYIQVKIYACQDHLVLLKELNDTTTDGFAISKADVDAIIAKGNKTSAENRSERTAWPKCFGCYMKLSDDCDDHCDVETRVDCIEETKKFDKEHGNLDDRSALLKIPLKHVNEA